VAEVTVIWNGDRTLAGLESTVARAMEGAGSALVSATKARVSAPYPPASRPGQPPHRRSGGLQGAMASRVSRSAGAVTLSMGVHASSPVADQAKALARGTGRMAPRPFLGDLATTTDSVVDAITTAVRSELGRS